MVQTMHTENDYGLLSVMNPYGDVRRWTSEKGFIILDLNRFILTESQAPTRRELNGFRSFQEYFYT